MRSSLEMEAAARRLWREWGEYRKFTLCGRCDTAAYCCAPRRSGPWLCLDCFDIGPEATAFARRNSE